MTLKNVFVFVVLLLSASVVLAECQNKRVKVQVLGSGGPELTDGRASTSYLIWLDGKAIGLIDAGSGSSLNYEKSGAHINDLEFFAFTHFHVDHSVDFPAYIKGSYFTQRTKNLYVFGPEGNKLMPSATHFVDGLFGEEGVFPYLNSYFSSTKQSSFKVLTKNINLTKHNKQAIYKSDDFALSAIPVHHGPLPALAWRVDLAGCSIAFSGDMNNQFQTLPVLANGVDILVAHNAIPEAQQGAGRRLHMPPSEIGKIAQLAGVKELILSHRMMRTYGKEAETLAIIKKYYQGPVSFADDMDRY